MVLVSVSIDIKASSSEISNVSYISSEPSHLLESFSSVLSNDSSNSSLGPVVVSSLDGDNLVSVREGSDGSSSPVEHPPLSVVIWVVVLDS